VRTISHRHVPMPINAKDARPNRSEAGTWGYKGRRLFVGNDPAHIAPRAPNGWAGPLRRAATWGAKPTAGTAPRSHPALSRMPGRRSGRGITITPAPPTHHPVASPNASRRGHSMTETSVGPSILRLLALQATVMPAARAAVGPRRPGSVSLPPSRRRSGTLRCEHNDQRAHLGHVGPARRAWPQAAPVLPPCGYARLE